MEPTEDVSPTSGAQVSQAKPEKRKKARSRTSTHGSPEPRGPKRRVPDERDDFDMRRPNSSRSLRAGRRTPEKGRAQDAGVRVHTARLPSNRKIKGLRPATSEDGLSPTGAPHRGPSGADINDPAAAAGSLPLSPMPHEGLDGAQSPMSLPSNPCSSMSQVWSLAGSPGALASGAALVRQPALRPPRLPQEPFAECAPNERQACVPLGVSLCALTTVVLLTLVTVAILKASWNVSVPLSSACTTHACLAYSRRLLSSINESANPCKSFTRFVCDGWRKEHSGTVWEEQFHHVLDKLTDSLKDIRVPQSGQNEEQRAAAVYRSCVSLLEGVRDELPAVQKALDDAGIVWPHPSADADVLYTLMYCSLKLGWDVLLDFDIVANSSGSSSSMVELIVGPGKLFAFLSEKHMRLYENDEGEANFEFLKERFLRNNTVTLTYSQMQDLEDNALKNLLYVWAMPTGSVESFPDASDLGLTKANWTATLQKINISLAEGPLLTTTNAAYVNAFLNLWRVKGSDSIHALVSWSTVQVAGLFANRELIYNYYDNNYKVAQVHYGIFCATRAMFFSRQALFARYNADVFHGKAGAVARELARSVRLAFGRRLSNWTYFKENVTLVADWSSLTTAFHNFEKHSEVNETFVRGQLPDMTDSFVSNWQHSTIVRNTPEVEQMLLAMDDLSYYVLSYGKRDFQLMPYALSFPLFDSTLPSSVNYGGFGFEVTVALGDLFLSFSDAKQILSLMDCLLASQFGDVVDLGFYAAQTIGLNALVDAYDSSGRASDNAVHGLEKYRGLPLVFIAMCYIKCDGSLTVGDGEAACNLPLQQLPQFAEAFACAPGEPMSPANRCELL